MHGSAHIHTSTHVLSKPGRFMQSSQLIIQSLPPTNWTHSFLQFLSLSHTDLIHYHWECENYKTEREQAVHYIILKTWKWTQNHSNIHIKCCTAHFILYVSDVAQETDKISSSTKLMYRLIVRIKITAVPLSHFSFPKWSFAFRFVIVFLFGQKVIWEIWGPVDKLGFQNTTNL